MINDKLLSEFSDCFYGYGNYNSPYWFLGMEEGGGNSVEELNRRFYVWEMRGKRELEDVAEYHIAINIPGLFSERPKLQNTWSKQIRVILGMTSQKNDTEIVRYYQRDLWGRASSENCVLDLFPLPSPRMTHWIYGAKSRLENLKNRDTYRESYSSKRIIHIKNRVKEFSPKVVIMFGLSYINYWKALAGEDFSEIHQISQLKFEKTRFVILKHPASRGINNEYFYNAGRVIADII